MLFRWSSISGIWENGIDKWGWLKSLETANFIQSIRQLILCGLRKLTWVKLLWVCVVYFHRAKPHMAKSCFSTEEYTGSFKHSVNTTSNNEWSEVNSLLYTHGRSPKHIPGTISWFEETEVTRLMSCFLERPHKCSEFSSRDSILGPCSNNACLLVEKICSFGYLSTDIFMAPSKPFHVPFLIKWRKKRTLRQAWAPFGTKATINKNAGWIGT